MDSERIEQIETAFNAYIAAGMALASAYRDAGRADKADDWELEMMGLGDQCDSELAALRSDG
jgi:hypothetical protein